MTTQESHKIDQLAERHDILSKDINDIKSVVDRIDVVLTGDKYNKGKGLTDRLEKVEERLTETEKTQLITKSKIAFGVMILGGIATFLAAVYYGLSIFHYIVK